MRLHSKLALFGAVLVLVGVGATGAAGLWLIDRQAERAARERLAAATDFAVAEYEGLLANARTTGEVLAARLPAASFAAVEAGEAAPDVAASLASLVRGPRRVEAADSIALIARDGTVLLEVVRDRGPSRGGQWPGDEAVMAALGGETALGVEVFPGGGLRAVAVLPVRVGAGAGSAGADAAGGTTGDAVAGVVAVTSFIDDEVADELRRITGFDVAFFAQERVVASAARRASGPAGAAAVGEEFGQAWPRVAAGEEVESAIGGPLRRALVRYAPLRDTGGDVVGAVAVSAEIELLGVGRRESVVLLAGAMAVVLTLALASDAYASRALSRPLTRLVAAARRMGAGDLASPVSDATERAAGPRRDEVAELAAEMEAMRSRLAAAAESQAELNRLKDEYLSSVAHELRSPLAALAASVELLAEEAGTEDAAAEPLPAGEHAHHAHRAHFVDIVRRHTATLRALVDNLLDLGSLRAGRFRIEPRPTAGAAVAEEALEAAAPELAARGQRVSLRASRDTPHVQADPRHLRQVLINLLSNAAKYGPEQSVVEVVIEERDGAVRFEVADRGPGIPSEERERLFDAYFRAESTSRAAPGVGLGLAIVKAIVDAHGGRLGVESAPGEGTRFWVELPAAGGATTDGHSEDGAADGVRSRRRSG